MKCVGFNLLSEMSKRNSSAVARLKQDYIRLKKDPVTIGWICSVGSFGAILLLQVPYIVAEPLPSNLLEWHYVVRYRLNYSVGGWYKRAFLYGFQSPGALRTVYTRVGYIMASWSSPQVRENRLCKFISRLYHCFFSQSSPSSHPQYT